ncbi:hypothetical protein [Azospirillum picis]|uniref:Uncharacterized protein n=1 Tax=Azospirillum picis TaxID=488438 RepID=A0ABU0MEG6_9PROT|nr:hypothetical protein [Azospirillum picis]MBP2297946.1 hypothetical protein [Azospirillum picis]MDQ0531784.1 hypothetical protein [Azospirillum picis]
MSEFSNAAEDLGEYNAGTYNATTNPKGYSGVGGMDANWVPTLRAVATVANGISDLADQTQQAVTQIAAAQSTLTMTWDASTADADPGVGEVRASTATLTAGSYTLYVSTTDAAGAAATNTLAGYAASSSSVKGRLRLVKVGAPGTYVDLDVTGATTATGYRKVGVTYVAGPGGFAAGDALALGFVRTGDKGDTGPLPTIATTSATSLTIGTGSKTLTTAAALNLAVGANLMVASTAAPSNWMFGQITVIGGTSVTINVSTVGGSGTFAAWTVSGGGAGPSGPSGTNGTNGTNGAGAVWYGTSAGSANAQTLSGSLASLTGNPSVEFVAGYTNTGTLTLAVGSTAATAVYDAYGAALLGGEVVAGAKYVVTYDGTRWRLPGGTGNALKTVAPSLNTGVTPNELTVDFRFGHKASRTVTANLKIIPTFPVGGGVGVLDLTNAGAYTITFSTGKKTSGGAPVSFTTSGLDRLTFIGTDADYEVVTRKDIK